MQEPAVRPPDFCRAASEACNPVRPPDDPVGRSRQAVWPRRGWATFGTTDGQSRHASQRYHDPAECEEQVTAQTNPAVVRIVGVDEWAWRKGTTFGTVIVDLERRQVVELLADRSAATTADWLKRHPEIEVVSRDRAGLYADAAREGAPQARQIADRFHLLKNLRETIERQLGRFEAPIRESRSRSKTIPTRRSKW